MEVKGICANCKHTMVHYNEEPCISCNGFQHWEPNDAKPVVIGFDPGAPEGDTTNTRLDWGETGPVLAVTRMPLETVISYAIDGIKDHASKIGLLLTDKTLGEHELFDLIHDLANLHERWVTLETERAAIREAVEHVKNPDA